MHDQDNLAEFAVPTAGGEKEGRGGEYRDIRRSLSGILRLLVIRMAKLSKGIGATGQYLGAQMRSDG